MCRINVYSQYGSFQLSVASLNFVFDLDLHNSTSKNLAPLFQPIRSKNKIKDLFARVFPCLPPATCIRFAVVIGQFDYFGFDFTTLNLSFLRICFVLFCLLSSSYKHELCYYFLQLVQKPWECSPVRLAILRSKPRLSRVVGPDHPREDFTINCK